jgi:Lar family restriction alleviation protein
MTPLERLAPTLLPCPFCGGEAIRRNTNHLVFYVDCLKCGAGTGRERCDMDSISAWNRRYVVEP